MRRHVRLNGTEQEKDDFLYQHFSGNGHDGFRDIRMQLIDRVNSEEVLRDKLSTFRHYGLDEKDFCSEQAFKRRVTYRVLVLCRIVARTFNLSRLSLLKEE